MYQGVGCGILQTVESNQTHPPYHQLINNNITIHQIINLSRPLAEMSNCNGNRKFLLRLPNAQLRVIKTIILLLLLISIDLVIYFTLTLLSLLSAIGYGLNLFEPTNSTHSQRNKGKERGRDELRSTNSTQRVRREIRHRIDTGKSGGEERRGGYGIEH